MNTDDPSPNPVEPAPMAELADWHCLACGEPVPGHFNVCWNCGADRLGMPDPDFEPALSFNPECASCGYFLVGLRENRCPECGAPFDPSEKDTPRPLPGIDIG